MRVLLIDVDGHNFPNLALMKLSAWHKANGDAVFFKTRQQFNASPLEKFDRVYASKVFTFSPDLEYPANTDDFRRGGTGYGVSSADRLPDDVEHMMPDYSLYGITTTAYGFMSRGCPRGCPFCVVAEKEGRAARKVANVREFWDGQQRIELLDPNVLACPDWQEILGQLAWTRAAVNINQGADIRLITPEKIAALNAVKLEDIHFAWDNAKDDLAAKFEEYAALARRKFHGAWATVYVLTNYNSTMEENLYRIETLRRLRFDPYVMIYDKQHAPREIKRLQRWCNNRIIFKSCNFKDYKG